ncbi:MAG: (Fe-S)-binding protein [Candidatus Krumholzibacteriia bacterium]
MSTRPVREPAGMSHQVADLLRSCVECGFCLPHCATFLATGNEALSPRGRLLLLGECLADPALAADRDVLRALDLCLGCRACETACPSGVPYSLLEEGRKLAAERGGAAPLPPGAARLDRRSALRWLRRSGGLTRTVLRALLGDRWRQRLDARPVVGRPARLLGTLPSSPRRDGDLLTLLDRMVAGDQVSPAPVVPASAPAEPDAPAGVPVRTAIPATAPARTATPAAVEMDPGSPAARSGPRRLRVVFFRGCASDALLGGTAMRLRSLLEAAGCEVVVPPGQDCCGALAEHAHDARRAQQLRSRNQPVLKRALAGADVVVAEAAGCSLELKDLGEGVGERVEDAIELLARLRLPALAAVPLTVALHDPCHARHGQGLLEAPRALLRRIPGLRLVTPHEADVCCGSGGPYSLRHPDLAAAMGRRKAAHLAATGARLVVTSNPGCLGQIADGLALVSPCLPVLPLTDLLWYAWRRAEGGGRRGWRAACGGQPAAGPDPPAEQALVRAGRSASGPGDPRCS